MDIAHRGREIEWIVNLQKNTVTMQQRHQSRVRESVVVVYEGISGSSGKRWSHAAKVWKARQRDLELEY